jgi:hypothetical protein
MVLVEAVVVVELTNRPMVAEHRAEALAAVVLLVQPLLQIQAVVAEVLDIQAPQVVLVVQVMQQLLIGVNYGTTLRIS